MRSCDEIASLLPPSRLSPAFHKLRLTVTSSCIAPSIGCAGFPFLISKAMVRAWIQTRFSPSNQSLQVEYNQVMATLLIELIDVQRSVASGSLVNDIPRSYLTFCPSASDSWVNGLWFTSLSLSLSTALFAVLTKQWIHQYMSSGTHATGIGSISSVIWDYSSGALTSSSDYCLSS
ncbi:hypothetical protein EDD18DRAFT_730481 [Armillaria luteobubalina]|uniref:DUF6535 domain-containing protein n=1 Tax=Armillaria luteobubalina TaxID=153913 RepID=A0AA39QG85_9AGAR|nr:hypothetical protein EDD18DRAFT_730481 [Armillaria luteobubalina]